jgi:hypothetical protein
MQRGGNLELEYSSRSSMVIERATKPEIKNNLIKINNYNMQYIIKNT